MLLKSRPFGEIAPTDREGATMSDHCGVYRAPASGSRDTGRKIPPGRHRTASGRLQQPKLTSSSRPPQNPPADEPRVEMRSCISWCPRREKNGEKGKTRPVANRRARHHFNTLASKPHPRFRVTERRREAVVATGSESKHLFCVFQ